MPPDAALGIVLKLLAVAALVLLNAFFVAAEFGLVKVRDTQLALLAERGHRRASKAREVLKRLDGYLSAAQLGITLASLGLGWIGEPVFAALLEPVFGWLSIASAEVRHVVSVVVGFTVITILHISAGEQAPKWLAIQKPVPTALWIAYPMHWFYRASYPFVVALNSFSQWILRKLGLHPSKEGEHAQSEEELRLLFAASQKQSGATKLGRDIVLNALDLRHRIARDVMRPRKEIVAFQTVATIAECLDLAEKTRYSRFPVCEDGDLDRALGVIHIKDLYASRLKALTAMDLLPSSRKLVFVPETARLEKTLQMLLDRRLHVALVVDEFGSVTGMMTLENILEEIVGQIQDEFDQENPLIKHTSPTTWEISGALPLRDLEELIGQPLQEEGIVTVSGFVTFRLGSLPKLGDSFELGSFIIQVVDLEGARAAKLTLIKAEQS